jgi:hypothetical protein
MAAAVSASVPKVTWRPSISTVPYAAKPHAEQRNALHSHFLKRHLGWDFGR